MRSFDTNVVARIVLGDDPNKPHWRPGSGWRGCGQAEFSCLSSF